MTKAEDDSNRRRKMRQKMEQWGMHPDEIKICVAEIRKRQLMKVNGDLPTDAPLCTRPEYVDAHAKAELNGQAKVVENLVELDDKGYLPIHYDPVLVGLARATGETAKAVKRRRTITKYEYDLANGKE